MKDISAGLMEEYCETIGFDLFEFEDGWKGKLEAPFLAWAETGAPDFFSEWPEDAQMLERLMKDEEESGSIAGFVNGLEPMQREDALKGMLDLLERDEQKDGEMYAAIATLLG